MSPIDVSIEVQYSYIIYYIYIYIDVNRDLAHCSVMIRLLLTTSHVLMRLSGLGVWFSLWVREVPGSNPGWARFIYYFILFYFILFYFLIYHLWSNRQHINDTQILHNTEYKRFQCVFCILFYFQFLFSHSFNSIIYTLINQLHNINNILVNINNNNNIIIIITNHLMHLIGVLT